MKLSSTIYFIVIIITILTNGCGNSRKAINQSNQHQNALVNPCDSMLKRLISNRMEFVPYLKNLDSRYKQFSVKINGTKDVYQIKWNYIKGVSEYNLFMNSIEFKCIVGSSNCELLGDEIIYTIDQVELGNKCLARGYSQSSNLFDCIYQNGWNVKVRVKVCDVYGDFSEVSQNISFQCGAK
jgi:hypothetical protein